MNHSPICRIFMLCEDNTAFIRAMDLRDSLANECRGQAAIFAIFSRFDWLYQPILKQHAKESVENADLIVIVAEGSRDLPPVARAWLASLARQPHARKPALALYLEEFSPDAPARLRTHIQQIAASLGVDFFSNLTPREPDPAAESAAIIPDGRDFTLTPQNITRLLLPLVPSHPPLL